MRDPVVVIEVLSPSTANRGVSIKATDYQGMPSVQEIVIVHTAVRRIDVWRRHGEDWIGANTIGDGTALLESQGIVLPLAEVYRNVEIEASNASQE